jgi:hypothetical protein
MNTAVVRGFTGALTDLVYGPVRNDKGLTVLPDSAALTINGIAGAGVVSVLGSGKLSYEFTAGETATLTEDVPNLSVRVEWTIDDGDGNDIERVQFFDVTDYALETGVNGRDLEELHPELRRFRAKYNGKATSGTTLALLDVNRLKGKTFDANFFVGSELVIHSGAAKGEHRVVTLSDPVTGTLEVDTAFTRAPGTADAYEIQKSWDSIVRSAWERIYAQVTKALGREQARKVVDGRDFRDTHLYTSLADALTTGAASVTASGEDRYSTQAVDYRQKAEAAMSMALSKLESTAVDPDTGQPVYTDRHNVQLWGAFL